MNNYDSTNEPEIINPGGKSATANPYRRRYTEYSTETRQASPVVFILSITAFFLSLIPVVGVCIAIVALIAARLKRTSMILSGVAFVIGCISTTLFLLLVMMLRIIF